MTETIHNHPITGEFHYIVQTYNGQAREVLASAKYTTPVYLN